MVNLNEMKVTELKTMAKGLGVSNWWTLKKNDLVTEISFKIADKEEAGEEVDVENLAATDHKTQPPLEPEDKPQAKEKPQNETGGKPKRGELIHYKGKAKNLCAWAEELGINPNTLYGRLYKLKWTVERAFAIKK